MDSLSLASRDRGLSLDDMAAHEDGYMTDSTMFTIHDDDENIEVCFFWGNIFKIDTIHQYLGEQDLQTLKSTFCGPL